ncbi:MAG: 5-methyltetrahydrofolate--homocysteine methyltransferase, partial [Bacteroidaceae bacterium]|nr:5-methyltetrahydrofolate--homocysteine methyltransferase [Bacteroidaceae bacterium]
CEAKGCDDNIIIEEMALPLLRQQHTQADKPNLCLSDFVSPYGDKIGLFATTIDSAFGAEHSDDPYHNLLAQTLADRLAEATASLMHRQIRTQKELWGYSQHEELTIKELLQEKNQGIRPAVGYPSLPDQSIIFEIDKIVNLGEIGITLTPNGAMTPHASVCGMIFAHPQARYFAVGRISDEQLADYAQRRGTTPPELKKYLSRNIE